METILILQLLMLLKTNCSLGSEDQLLLNQSTSQILCEDVEHWLHPDSPELKHTAAPRSLTTVQHYTQNAHGGTS